MATIRGRKRADGTMSYTAQIRIKKNGAQVYTESQTFARKKAAEAWAKRRETELSEPGALVRAKTPKAQLKDVIAQYLAEVGKAQPLGITKEQTLERIANSYLGQMAPVELTSQVLVDFALWRMSKEGGAVKPQTVGNDLAHLGAVLTVARPAWGHDVNPAAMVDARQVLKKLGYKLVSRERDRRVTPDELGLLLTLFSEVIKVRPLSVHMPKIVLFAFYSTRRQEEIIRIRWDDLDEKRQAVLVRDMKNPGNKWGNDTWCHLPDEAWAIIQSMPRVYEEIFPWTVDAIQGAWARAYKRSGIKDLRFHDLRHAGVSRLFEMDWDIPRVASVSGHRDWNSLRRYTHLHGRGDLFANWDWLPKVLAMPVTFGATVAKNKRQSGT
ncbi:MULTISPECIES: site-specific integrase [unclassified Pseudomonas]|uniref:integrase n=1 Tax=unclassified Pseudomonas TaxID=196821 RepID=UPI00177F1FAF|nr:site-specific integrase [Pseudomonas sp. PDM11]MBD9398014.1 site-specific integrase [Pseudomonas sp. PDM11]